VIMHHVTTNVMITKLADILPNFDDLTHTHCFLHIVNLVAKSIIKQFDIPKRQDNDHLDEAEQELHNLAGDIDLENEQAKEAIKQCQISSELDVVI